MKRLFLTLTTITVVIFTHAQVQDIMVIEKNNGTTVEYGVDDIRQVTFKQIDNLCPDGNHPHMIDLGLPSGTLWSCCNVGASRSEQYGLYFAWGETQGYTSDTSDGRSFEWASYKWCNGSYDTMTKYCINDEYGYNGFTDGLAELLPEDDAATANWGSDWRMPSYEQCRELINSNYTTTERTTLNGVNGRKITSKSNGNSIFLPAAGIRQVTRFGNAGTCGNYWSRSLATDYSYDGRILYFLSGPVITQNGSRYYGRSVRPVCAQNNFTPVEPTTTYTVNGVEFKMVAIEGGTFTMGASEQDSYAFDSEKPAHQVTLDGFSIGETEVTQELWEAVMGSNPSYFKGNKLPVECVSWNDCQTFITKLNELTGQTFRLPTEAEWEYAARGGTSTSLYNGENINILGKNNSSNLDLLAWYGGNCGQDYTESAGCDVSHGYDISEWPEKQYNDSKGGTHPVGLKQPNAFGLYDMLGNVWEWCQDWYDSYSSSAQTNPTGPSSGSNRVRRGGGWYNNARYCRVSIRSNYKPSSTADGLGFRLAQ